MPACKHRFEVEGMIREKDRKGVEKVIRSYRCQACGAICTDKTKAAMMAAQPAPQKAPQQPAQEAPSEEESEMAEKKNGEKSGRLERSLADGWEQGKTYKKDVKRRKDGKTFTCKMTVMKSGFKDQDGEMWDSPTALTTNFMNKKVGVSGRRPAKAFFPDAPKAKSIATRPGSKSNGSAKKASKPAKKAPAKAATKPAAKPTTAPKKAETKAPVAKAEASAPAAKALEELPEL